MEVYRAELIEQVNGWLGKLPDKIQAISPRDTPVWLPFWFLFGPIAAYLLYLPVNAQTELRSAVLLGLSTVIFDLSRRWRRRHWWQGQPIAFLLLAPFALPNMLLVWALKLLTWGGRRVLGSRANQLARVGFAMAMVGFVMDVYQTTVVLAPPPRSAPCGYSAPGDLGR